jgi:multimeric flavodoxin WrbA
MKCVIVHGSYRKGNTYKVTEIIEKYMGTLGDVEFEEVFLSQHKMEFCLGCNRCFLEGEEFCPHNNIIRSITKKIEEADALIVTTPVHSLQLSDLLKCWIDHMSYNFHRPRYFNKKGLVLATTAGAGTNAATKHIRDVLKHWGFNNVYRLNIQCASLDYNPNEKALKKIQKVAHKFYEEASSKKLHKPTTKRIFYFNLWRVMVLLGMETKSKDYRYWQETRMCNMAFAEGVPIGIFGKAFGNLVYILLKKVMEKMVLKEKRS